MIKSEPTFDSGKYQDCVNDGYSIEGGGVQSCPVPTRGDYIDPYTNRPYPATERLLPNPLKANKTDDNKKE